MFRIEIFCDDKNLARILQGLSGLILGQPNVQPVVNAKMANGHITAETSGDELEMWETHIRKHKITELSGTDAKEYFLTRGKSSTTYAYWLRQAVEAGILKRRGKGTGMKYIVQPKKA